MSRIDLHVDELLDLARQDALSASDRARLTAHCEVCVACRMELAWLGDGLHRATPSAADRALGASAVEALLGREFELSAIEPRPARSAVRWRRAALLACAWLLSASAAAALYTEVRAWRAREPEVQVGQRAAAKAERTASPQTRRKARLRSAAPTPAVMVEPAIAAVEPAIVAVEPIAATQEAPVRESVVPDPVAHEPTPSATPALPLAVLRERRAEALFARANAERAAGRNDEALTDYAQLERAFPGTRNALASRISRADLLRRMDQPQQALEVYQGYLRARPDGALAEEARAGIAASYQRLGRDEQERAAWQELLDHHSDSLHALRARARLLALSR